VVAGISAVLVLLPSAYLGWLGLVATGMLLGRELLRHGPALLVTTTVFATALTHAVFFGASRYALVCLPALSALVGALWLRLEPENERPQAQG
jgi:hypothetical protein